MDKQAELQKKTFFEQLQNSPEIDLRDNRGKIHDLCLILMGLTIGLLRGRDGCLSSNHRSMVNTQESLCSFLGIENTRVVSRSHLPIVLQKVNVEAFDRLLFLNYGICLSDSEKKWFAGDGKELRGSIQSGNTRGQAVVQLVSHDDKKTLGQSYFNGSKESERPCLRNTLTETKAKSQKITLDALHLCPETTEMINQSDGIFEISLKANQEELLEDMKMVPNYIPVAHSEQTLDKGHGRIEQRCYQVFDISQEYFDPRWQGTEFQTLLKVDRKFTNIQTEKLSQEIAYYISNAPIEMAEELCQANRKHWTVEANNSVRDVSFKEDQLKTKIDPVSKVFASLRTLALNLIRTKKTKNIKATMELFQDNYQILMNWLRQINFL